ncbi:hypothetical protein DFH06DRAFT_1179447, partial [Mycena polygramma]
MPLNMDKFLDPNASPEPDSPTRTSPPHLILESDRIKQAPHLSLSLSASSPYISVSGNKSFNSDIAISTTIHYHTEPHDRPIVFRKESDARYALLIWPDDGDSGEGPQEIVQEELCQVALAWDKEPEAETISISAGSGFQSLAPGQSVQETWRGFCGYQESFKVGKKYTFQYIGGVIDWWDWGTVEDHKDEWVGLYETSHDARPRIVIPASNALEFVAVE